MTDPAIAETLYRTLLQMWNERDAAGYGELFTDDGSLVGFDGSSVESRRDITEHLTSIFKDHTPATYVAKVREIRQLSPTSTLLRGVAGMVPPRGDDIDPGVNAVQAMVSVEHDGRWRVGHFQSTPAAFHGRPEEAEALSAELRQVLAAERSRGG
jgi:uncharacterized protein (TIGR02246 family)